MKDATMRRNSETKSKWKTFWEHWIFAALTCILSDKSKYAREKKSIALKALLTMKRSWCVCALFPVGETGQLVLPQVPSWLACCSGVGSYKLSVEPSCNAEMYELKTKKKIIFLEIAPKLSTYLYIVLYLNYARHRDQVLTLWSFSTVNTTQKGTVTTYKSWNEFTGPSKDEWIKKIWYTHTMEYYSVLK